MTWTHDDLAADLAGHLRGPGRMVWCDMQLGPQGSPRPDVYAIDRSFVKWSPTAYEVKISVADFRSDVTSGKWMSYRRYAGAVVFAVPAGLVAPADLPQGCGLMVRGEAGWRTARKPTRQVVESLPTAAWLKLLMDGVDREGGAMRLETGRRMRMDAHASRLFGQAVPFSPAEMARLPPKHDAHRNPGLLVERSVCAPIDMPPLTRVTNREAVFFDGARPETTQEARGSQ